MASLERAGLQLELGGFQKFLDGGQQVNKLVDKMSSTATKAATAFTKLERVMSGIGSLKGVESSAKSISVLSRNLKAFSRDVSLEEVNEIFKQFRKEIRLLAAVDLKSLPEDLPRLAAGLTQFSKALRSFTSGKNIDKLPKQLAAINRELPKLIQGITGIDGKEFLSFNVRATNLATNLKALASAFRDFTRSVSGNGIAKAVTNAVESLTGLDKVLSGFSSSGFTANLKPVTDALQSFAKVVASFGRVKGIKEFAGLIKDVGDGLELFAKRDLKGLAAEIKLIAGPIQDIVDAAKALRQAQRTASKGTAAFEAAQKRSVKAAKAAAAANIQYRAAIIQVVGALIRATPAIARFGVTLLKLPIKVVTTTLKTLNNVLIKLPFKVVTGTFKLFASAVTGSISKLNGLINWAIDVDKNLKRIKRGLSLLLTPFRPLIALINALTSAFARLVGQINIFNRSSKSTEQSLDKQSQGFKETSREADRAGDKIENLTVEVKQSGRAAGVAGNAFQTLAGVLVARGVGQAIKRFVSLQLTLRSLSVLSNLVSTGFNILSFELQNLVRTGFTAAAEFEGIALSINSAFARDEVKAGNFDNIKDALAETTDESDALLERLRQLAIASPFNRSALADVFLAGRNFGFAADTAEGLTQVMADLGAGLNLNAADMREVVRALGQIKSGGASLQDLSQIGDRGIEIFDQLAINLGKTKGELRGLISAKGVTTGDVFTAFADIAENFQGQAALATGSLKGLLATFQDFRSDAIRNLFTPILDGLKPLAAAFLSIGNIDATILSFKTLGETIAGRVVPFITNLISKIEIVQAVFAGIPQPVKDVLFQVGKFAAIVAVTSLAVGALSAFMGVAIGVFFTFVNPLTIAIGVILGLISSTNAFTSALSSLASAAVQTGKTLLGLVEGTVTLEDAIALIPNPIDFIIGKLKLMRDAFIRDFNTIVGFVGRQVNSLVDFFGTSIETVTKWGSDLVSAFADGIIAAVGLVADALAAIGNEIAFWLAPGSPPRIVPNIDTWGTDAANEFLGGFTSADFGLISDFGGTVDDLLQSLNVEGIDTSSIVNSFAGLIDEINTTGTFDEEGFNTLISGAGSAQLEVASLANEFLTLQVEQRKLNALTGDYAEEIGNVSNQLSSLDDEQAFENEAKDLERLQQRLNNRFISDTERVTLERQIARITAERRQRELEAERRLAEQSVDNAQSAIDRTQERLRLAQDFAVEADALLDGGTSSGSSGRIKKPKVKKPKKGKKEKPKVLEGALDEAQARLAGFAFKAPDISNVTDRLSAKFEETRKTVSDTFSSIQTRVTAVVTRIQDKFKEWGITTEVLRLSLVALGTALAAPAIISSLGTLSVLLTPAGALVAGVVALAAGFTALVVSTGSVEGAITSITTSFGKLQEGFALARTIGSDSGVGVLDIFNAADFTTLETAGQAVGAILGTIANSVEDKLIAIKDTVLGVFSGDTSIGELLGNFFTFEETSVVGQISTAVTKFIGLVNDNFITPIRDAFANNDTILTTIRAIYTNVYGGIIQNAVDGIGEVDIDFTGAIAGFFNNSGLGMFIETEFAALFGGIDLSDSIGKFIKNFGETFTQISTSAQNLIQPIFDLFSGDGPATGDLGFLGRILEQNQEAFSKFFEVISSDRFIDNIGKLASVLGVVLGGAISLVALLLDSVLIGVLKNFGNIFNNIIEGAEDIILGFVAIFQGDFLGGISQVLAGVGQLFEGIFGGLTDIITDSISAILEFIGIDSAPLRPFLKILTDIVLFFASGGASAFKFGGAIIKGILPASKLLFKNLGDIGGVIKLVFNAFRNVGSLTDFISVMRAVGKIVRNVATQAFGGLFKLLKGAGTGIFNTIKNAFTALTAPIAKAVKPIKTFASNILAFIPGGKLIVGVIGRITNALRSIGPVVSGVIRTFSEFFNSDQSFSEFGIGLIKSFIDGLTAGLSLIGTFLSTAFSSIFTEWLAPASPPKFLPDIDTWGLDTALEFVLGFLAAPLTGIIDFGKNIITSLASVFTPEAFNGILDKIRGIFTLENLAQTAISGTLNLIDLLPISDEQVNIAKQEFADVINSISDFDEDGFAPVAISLAKFITVSEEGKEALEEKIKGFLPNLDSIFGEGSTESFAINLADLVTIDEGELEGIIETMTTAFENLKNFSLEDFDIVAILQTIRDTFNSIAESFGIELPSPFDVFSAAITIAAELISAGFELISTGYSKLGVLFKKKLPNPIGTALSIAAELISRAFGFIADQYQKVADFFNTDLNDPFADISNTIQAVRDFFDRIDESISNFIERINSLRDNAVLNFVIGEPENADEVAQRTAQELSDSLASSGVKVDATQLLQTDATEVSDAGTKLATDFSESVAIGLTQGQRDRDKVIQLLNQGVTGEEIVALGSELGLDFNAGIVEGLTSEDNGTQEARDVAAAILTAAQAQLGIQSPSTEARDLIGKPIIEGIVAGLTLEGTTADETIKSAVDQIINIFETNFTSLSATSKGLLNSLFELDPTVTTKVTTVITQIITQFRRLNTQQTQLVAGVTKETQDLTEDMAVESFKLIETFVVDSLQQFRNLADNAVAEMKNMVDTIIEELERLARDGGKFIEQLVDKFEEEIERFVDLIEDDAKPAIQSFIDRLDKLQREGTSAIQSFVSASKTALLELIEVFKQAGQDAVQGLIDAITNASVSVVTAMESLVGDVKTQLNIGNDISFFLTTFEPAGKDIVRGLVKGMADNEDLLISEAQRLAGIVDNSFTTASGIFSPSKVFAEHGKNIVLGLVQGLDDNASIAALSVVNLALLLTNTARVALGIQSPSKVAYSKIGAPFVDGITSALSDGHGSVSSAASALAGMMSTNSLTQPIDVKYAGLLNTLPNIKQGIDVKKGGYLSGKIPMLDKIGKTNSSSISRNSNSIQGIANKRMATNYNGTEPIQSMTNSVNNANTTTSTVNNYSMSIVTSERAAAKVTSNYRRMRLKKI